MGFRVLTTHTRPSEPPRVLRQDHPTEEAAWAEAEEIADWWHHQGDLVLRMPDEFVILDERNDFKEALRVTVRWVPDGV